MRAQSKPEPQFHRGDLLVRYMKSGAPMFALVTNAKSDASLYWINGMSFEEVMITNTFGDVGNRHYIELHYRKATQLDGALIGKTLKEIRSELSNEPVSDNRLV